MFGAAARYADSRRAAPENEALAEAEHPAKMSEGLVERIAAFHECGSPESQAKHERDLANCREILRRYLLLDFPPPAHYGTTTSRSGSSKEQEDHDVVAARRSRQRRNFQPLGWYGFTLHLVFADPDTQLRELSLMVEMWIVFAGLLTFVAYGFLTVDVEGIFRSSFSGYFDQQGNRNHSYDPPWEEVPLLPSGRSRILGKVAAVLTCIAFMGSIILSLFQSMMISHFAALRTTRRSVAEEAAGAGGGAGGSLRNYGNGTNRNDEHNFKNKQHNHKQEEEHLPGGARLTTSSRTVALVNFLKTVGFNFYLCGAGGFTFLWISVLMYCLTLLPAKFGIAGIVACVAFLFVPDYSVANYWRSTGGLATVHYPLWQFKIFYLASFIGATPRNKLPTFMGGELEIAARSESLGLIRGLITRVAELEKLPDREREQVVDLWEVLQPVLEEAGIGTQVPPVGKTVNVSNT